MRALRAITLECKSQRLFVSVAMIGVRGWPQLSSPTPRSHAQSYADVFDDNRIRVNMLPDLTKEILQVFLFCIYLHV